MKPKNFDFVARFYPLLERAAFGNALNEARLAYLASIAASQRVLLVGEGNGRFLAALLREKAGGHVTVVDSSGQMLATLRERIQPIQRRAELTLVCADFRAWQPDQEGFDMIVTHFFLDLFRPETQRRLLTKLTALARPGAQWIDVDYAPHALTLRTRCIDWLQYRFDRLFSGVEADRHYDPASVIGDAGWRVQEEEKHCRGGVSARLLVLTSIEKLPVPTCQPLVPRMVSAAQPALETENG